MKLNLASLKSIWSPMMGGDPKGDFIQSLNFSDITTGWVEMIAVKNKAQVWVFGEIEGKLPFSILGIDLR